MLVSRRICKLRELTGQKVVANEHAEEDEIVNDALHVKGERQLQHAKLQLEVFPQQPGERLPSKADPDADSREQKVENLFVPNLEKDKMLAARVVQHLAAGLAPVAALAKADNLAQQAKMGLMRDERQHDQVRIQAVEAVSLIWLIIWLPLRPADVLHDLVLTLAWYVMACASLSMELTSMFIKALFHFTNKQTHRRR